MAPKTGTKRGRKPIKDAPEAKARKIDSAPKGDPMLDGVIAAVKDADLPEQCKQMLIAVIPGSFGVPANERHASQEAVIDMIGRMMDTSKAKMAAGIDEQKIVMASTDSKKETLVAAVHEAEAQVGAATTARVEKEQALEIAKKTVQEKLQLLEDAKGKQNEGDKALVDVQSEKERYEAALGNEFKFLFETEARTETEVKNQYDTVKPLIDKLGLDDSLSISIFAACDKAPSTRGTFDNMVIEQVQQHIRDKISNLEEQLTSGAPGKAERAAATEAAQANFEQVQAAQAEANEELVAASTTLADASTSLAAAQVAMKDFETEHKKATLALDAKVAVLQQFEAWNVECFTTLKSKTSIPKENVIEEDCERMGPAPIESAGA